MEQVHCEATGCEYLALLSNVILILSCCYNSFVTFFFYFYLSLFFNTTKNPFNFLSAVFPLPGLLPACRPVIHPRKIREFGMQQSSSFMPNWCPTWYFYLNIKNEDSSNLSFYANSDKQEWKIAQCTFTL